MVSAWHEYVGGGRGSGNVSSVADVLGMTVVRGMRGVGGVCEMCVFGSGGVGCEWIRGLGLDFNNPVGIGGVWMDVCILVVVL